MTTFGEKLRGEREARNITLREIATETKIGLRYLKALESGDFATLPGGVFNKGYVRAYATYIGADAEDLVQAYLNEERTRGADGEPDDREVLRALADSASPGSSRRPAVRPGVLLVPLAVALLAVAAWTYIRFAEPGEGPVETAAVRSAEVEPASVETEPLGQANVARTLPPAAPEPEPETEPAESPPVELENATEPPLEVVEVAEIAEPAPAPTEPTAAEPSRLSVPDSGVGTGVVNRQLQGQSDRFTEGTQIWFWTRVMGGETGDHVRHVWFHDGRQISSVDLRLGGPHWRTQSRKTLLPDSVGRWAVEARDTDDRVLAREEFVCVR